MIKFVNCVSTCIKVLHCAVIYNVCAGLFFLLLSSFWSCSIEANKLSLHLLTKVLAVCCVICTCLASLNTRHHHLAVITVMTIVHKTFNGSRNKKAIWKTIHSRKTSSDYCRLTVVFSQVTNIFIRWVIKWNLFIRLCNWELWDGQQELIARNSIGFSSVWFGFVRFDRLFFFFIIDILNFHYNVNVNVKRLSRINQCR